MPLSTIFQFVVVSFIGGGTHQSNKDMMCSVIAQYLTSKEIIIIR
jgi:hypothetical protein